MINGNAIKSINNPASILDAGRITSARTFDGDIMKLFYLDPDIWNPMKCDESIEVSDIDFEAFHEEMGDEYVFVASMIDGELAGLFMFSQTIPQCYEIHSALLRKFWGKGVSSACGLSACKWIFKNIPCIKIVTSVPSYNKSALNMALKAGMVIEGVNRKSFLKDRVIYDQTLLGFTKEEALCL